MNQNEIKAFIAQKVPEGYSLSKIQDLLKEQGVHITFMELRLIAAEVEESVFKKEEEKAEASARKNAPEPEAAPESSMPEEESGDFPAEEEPPFPAGEPAGAPVPPMAPPPEDAQPAAPRGKTVVELSKLARPGAVASGTVKFGSGVTAEWLLDQTGRLGLNNPSGKPDQQDIQEFQVELQKLFS